MAEIISIDRTIVHIGTDSGTVVKVPIGSIAYPNPHPGDQIKVYKDGNAFVVTKVSSPSTAHTEVADVEGRKINKHLFVWLFSFFLGGFGVDRFVRGQIGWGILKLLFWWITFGIWPFVDWIIAIVKAYGSAFGDGEYLVFTANGRYAK